MRTPGPASTGRAHAALWVALALLLAGGVPRARAGVEMFMRISGVAGESTDAVHAGDIEITGFSWSASSPATVTGPAHGGYGNFSNITVVKRVDKTSPKLMLETFSSTPIPDVRFYVRTQGANPFEYLRITLTSVFINSIQQNGNQADSAIETISLSYAKIQIEVLSRLASGNPGPTATRYWNIQTQTGG